MYYICFYAFFVSVGVLLIFCPTKVTFIPQSTKITSSLQTHSAATFKLCIHTHNITLLNHTTRHCNKYTAVGTCCILLLLPITLHNCLLPTLDQELWLDMFSKICNKKWCYNNIIFIFTQDVRQKVTYSSLSEVLQKESFYILIRGSEFLL